MPPEIKEQNPHSSVVAETMKLLANSCWGYRIKDGSQRTVTKYINEKNMHSAINRKLFKKLNIVNKASYEVELAKAAIEHKELKIVGFFILQYAKLWMLELYWNFFTKFCVVHKLEELEMDTDALCLALAEKDLEKVSD